MADPLSKTPPKVRYTLGKPTKVQNASGLPWQMFNCMPDAHLPCFYDHSRGVWRVIWAGAENFITSGSSPYPEDQTEVGHGGTSFADGRTKDPGWHESGTWMMALFVAEGPPRVLVGLMHCEDHYTDTMRPGTGPAWKCCAVMHSHDGGETWTASQQIVTPPLPRPTPPVPGGAGDFSVVKAHGKYWMFYAGGDLCQPGDKCNLRLAVSEDPLARPGTWYKLHKGEFKEPGLGGREDELPCAQPGAGGKLRPDGSNPSVHWNTHLEQWIMTWHGWDPPSIYIAASHDLIHWGPTTPLVAEEGRQIRYPTILGEGGDSSCGQRGRLYYTDMNLNNQDRYMGGRDILFHRSEGEGVCKVGEEAEQQGQRATE